MLKGTHHTPETRLKMQAASLGRGHTPETRLKMSRTRSGGHHTDETRRRIRAALMGHSVTDETREKIAAANRVSSLGNRHWRDAPVKGECAYCLGPATTIDHVIPLKRGGAATEDNIVPACASCNASKGNRTPDEWLAGERPVPTSRWGQRVKQGD